MCADRRAVDHLQGRRVRISVRECLQHHFPNPRQRPASELPIDRTPDAEFLRQITPGRAGTRNPENAIQPTPMIAWWPTAAGPVLSQEWREDCPFLVAHQSTSQNRLPPRGRLESQHERIVNRVCQRDLERKISHRNRHDACSSLGPRISTPKCLASPAHPLQLAGVL